MRTGSTAVRAGAALLVISLATAACSSGSKSGATPTAGSSGSSSASGGAAPAANTGKTIIWGSTDTPVSFDPAGSYDLPSWNVIYNVYQTLLRVDQKTQKLVPDAATGCTASTDFKVW